MQVCVFVFAFLRLPLLVCIACLHVCMFACLRVCVFMFAFACLCRFAFCFCVFVVGLLVYAACLYGLMKCHYKISSGKHTACPI
jgi:hypothetical protein